MEHLDGIVGMVRTSRLGLLRYFGRPGCSGRFGNLPEFADLFVDLDDLPHDGLLDLGADALVLVTKGRIRR